MYRHPHRRDPAPWSDRLLTVVRRLLAILAALATIARAVSRC